ncbi:hypothetical protein HI792_15860 [Ralstonia solanacearum]|nr:hypothetical protein HI792_15860 [Ralstonia solanacearum]
MKRKTGKPINDAFGSKVRKSFDTDVLDRLRGQDCVFLFSILDGYFKRDRTFVPAKDATTERWHCCTTAGEFELLVTGTKFFDPRSGAGGGGAIDLVMKLYQVPFVNAVHLLVERGL